MTTENMAILFSDVVNSTELSQQLSPEEADEVRRGHFSILRQALAATGGTEVKNLGDGLMVVFDSASAALACGVVMQQGVEVNNRNQELAIGLRVGLSQGEVTKEGDDYFGDPVIEAVRLCDACESGQVLAAQVVRLMAGRRNRHQCHPLGELRLKGLSDPVETVEVLWEPISGWDPSNSIPLPARLAVRPGVGLVGRETEIQTIADANKHVGGDRVREVLLISGEAGVGKTALVAEAARAAFDAGSCVLFGHCEEDLATPYQLFAEALNHYVTHAVEDRLLNDVGEHGSDLVPLVPALLRRLPQLPASKATDADTERFLLFAAVVRLLANVSEHQPVVLVFEDLQWADKGSLLLLRHLINAEHVMQMLVIGTFRDSELSRTHPLVEALAALHRQSGVSRIDLTGLDDTGVVSLMEATAGQAMDDTGVRFAHAVYNETDGNPFFVGEVLRHLSETGAIYQDSGGRWTAQGPPEQIALPESVRVVIGARVGRLGPVAEHVLSVAAVIGRDFDLELLAHATGITEEELLDILDAAIAAALVRELANTAGRYVFVHALIQHTLYEDLGPTRRARAHRQVAEALEELCGHRPGARVGELARHWFSAVQPVDLMKAIEYSHQAADAALIALAPDDARRYYSQALDILARVDSPDEELGLDLRIGLGIAERQTGDPRFRDTLLGAARRAADIGDTDRLVAATLANDRGTFSTVDTLDAEKVDILELALDRLAAERPERALLLAMLCSELTIGSPLDRRKDLADEAIAIAEQSGDDVTIVQVLNHVSLPLAVPSLLEWSVARTSDGLVRAERIGDPLLLCAAASGRRYAAACAGDIVEMDRCFEIKRPLVEQLDQPFLTWVHTLQRATRALIAGDTDEAEHWAMEAFQVAIDGGQPDAAVIFGAQFIMVSLWRGTLGDLIPMIQQTIDDNPGLPVFVAALALAHSEADHAEESRLLLQRFATTGFDLPLDATWLTGMIAYAEAAVELRDPQFAGPMFERLSPFADQWLYTDLTSTGPISRTLGGLATVLGRFGEAESYFSHSAAVSDRVGAKFFAARTELSWGRMLLERRNPGDAERARELLTRAQAAAASQGYGTVARRATSALTDIG
jgi:class 3 adenylate cyclase